MGWYFLSFYEEYYIIEQLIVDQNIAILRRWSLGRGRTLR